MWMLPKKAEKTELQIDYESKIIQMKCKGGLSEKMFMKGEETCWEFMQEKFILIKAGNEQVEWIISFGGLIIMFWNKV